MLELVSVVITSYNAGEYFRQCVDSVLQQTYSNLEIIIVNDGSTDDTDGIAREYVEKHSNVRYFYQENSGVSVARNLGINNANGKHIMFVDGDDYLDKHIVEKLADEIGDSDVICCCCNAFTEREVYIDHFFSFSFVAKTQEEKEKLYLQLLNGNIGKPNGRGYTAIGVPWGKLYRIDFLINNKILFDPSLKRMQDNMFNLFAFYHARQIKYADSPLYYYRLDHIQNKSVVYSENIWLQLLNARKFFFDSFPQICTDSVSTARFYEENIALYSMSISIVRKNKMRDAIKGISQVRENKIFAPTFLNDKKIRTPIYMTLFRILMKYRLHFVTFVFLKIIILIRN